MGDPSEMGKWTMACASKWLNVLNTVVGKWANANGQPGNGKKLHAL
mgnify:CR=1 FL=1